MYSSGALCRTIMRYRGRRRGPEPCHRVLLGTWKLHYQAQPSYPWRLNPSLMYTKEPALKVTSDAPLATTEAKLEKEMSRLRAHLLWQHVIVHDKLEQKKSTHVRSIL